MRNGKKKLIVFARNWVSMTLATLIFDYLFRPSNIDFLRNSSVALGVSLALLFYGDKIKKMFEK